MNGYGMFEQHFFLKKKSIFYDVMKLGHKADVGNENSEKKKILGKWTKNYTKWENLEIYYKYSVCE